MMSSLSLLIGVACLAVPPRDGAVDERRALDVVVDDFESADARFGFGPRTAAAAGVSAKVRNGIQMEGVRSLLVNMPANPVMKGDYESHLQWKFSAPRDFSEMDGFTMSFFLMESVKRVRVVLIEPDGTFYWALMPVDPLRLNEWQTVVIPTEFVWFHEGNPARKGVTQTDLRRISAIDIRFMTDPKRDVAFGLDAVGFVRAREGYAGPRLSIDGTETAEYVNWGDEITRGKSYVNWMEDRPFRFAANWAGGTADRDYDVDFWSLGWGFSTTNHLGTARIAKGSTSFSCPLEIPARGPGFWRCVAVVSADGVPVYRTSRGYTMMRGLRKEDEGPNPDSVFGSWTGPAGIARKLGVKRWRRFLWATQVKFDDDHRPVDGLDIRPTMDLDTTLCFTYMPRWLTSKPDAADWRKYPPTDYAAYEDYIAAGTAANLKNGYRRYQIWNEPVPYANWRGTVADLIPLARATCRGIKRVQPDAEFIAPCGYSFLPEFLEEFLRLGGTNIIDGVDIHTYTPVPPDVHFVNGLKGTRALMRKYGIADKPLYITEMGYATPAVCEEDIAAFMVRCYLYAWEDGVKFVIWHDVRCWKDDPPDYEMMSWDLTPRAHFTAYGVMTRELERAKMIRRIGMPLGTQVGFEFERRGVRIFAVWDREAVRGAVGRAWCVPLPAGRRAVLTDIQGAERTLLPDAEGKVTVFPARDVQSLRFE